jgi:hypothetical protein
MEGGREGGGEAALLTNAIRHAPSSQFLHLPKGAYKEMRKEGRKEAYRLNIVHLEYPHRLNIVYWNILTE